MGKKSDKGTGSGLPPEEDLALQPPTHDEETGGTGQPPADVQGLTESIDSVRNYVCEANREMSQEISQSVSAAMMEIRETNLHLTASVSQLTNNMNAMTAGMNDLLAVIKQERKGKAEKEEPLIQPPPPPPRFGVFGAGQNQQTPKNHIPNWYQASSSHGGPELAGHSTYRPIENLERRFILGGNPEGSQTNQGHVPPPAGGQMTYPPGGQEVFMQDARGAWPLQTARGQNDQAHSPQARPPPPPPQVGRDQIIAVLREQLGPDFRPIGRPMYTKPHPDEIDQQGFPKGFRVPEFHVFSGENPRESTVEHVARFHVQCGEAATRDEWKLRLFPNSLTATTFTWYINLPPNSILTWRQMEETFHQQFYRVEPEVTMADLSGLFTNCLMKGWRPIWPGSKRPDSVAKYPCQKGNT